MQNNRKSILVFLAIAFGLAWILFLLPLVLGQGIALFAWSAAMWAPGLAAIIATRKVDNEPLNTLGLNRLGERRAYVWAWLTPAVLAVAAGALTVLLGVGKLDLEFTMIRDALAQQQGAGPALPPMFVVLIQIASGLTIGPLFNTLFAMGEELGWRAYLLPKLLPLGQLRAIVLSGVIWGVWHWPAILQGHNYPQHPILGMFLMIGFCILIGAFFSWLYLRTRSPWAPALGHASLNAIAGLPLLFMTDVDLAFGGTLTSVIGWIPIAALVGWLLWSKRLPVVEAPLETEPLGSDLSSAVG